jgi:hypothetical protein
MWSHYANGHKGVAVEVEIPEEHEDLTDVTYTPFSSVFVEKPGPDEDLRHLFNGKGEEWAYEQEYRIITRDNYFVLPHRVKRLLIGPLIDSNHERILREIIPRDIAIVEMELNRIQGTLHLQGPGVEMPKLPNVLR